MRFRWSRDRNGKVEDLLAGRCVVAENPKLPNYKKLPKYLDLQPMLIMLGEIRQQIRSQLLLILSLVQGEKPKCTNQ